ncbi:MAG: FecR domain-containing protein [Parvibaculaceae bacterium]
MRIYGQIQSFFAAAALVLCAGLFAPALAIEDRAWTVESQSGAVWVKQDNLQPIALTPQDQLRAGATIETGADGRVVLIRGEESIIISPSTSIALPEDSSRGMATTILQSFGTILLQVEKRASQHFEVETPFLAAVVKGTKFTVTVDPSGAAVHVVEGAVEVLDLDTGDVGMVRPGQTAYTPAAAGVGLSVGGPGAAAPARAAAPERPNKPVPAPAAQQEAAAPAKAPAVLAALGSFQALDVGQSTKGLARAADVSNGRVSANRSSGEAVSDVTAGNSGTTPRGVAAGLTGAAPGLANAGSAATSGASSASNGLGAGGNGSGAAVGLSGSTPAGSAGGGSPASGGGSPAASNAGGGASGLSGGSPAGLPGNGNANAGGSGNGNSAGLRGSLPPGLGGGTPGNGNGRGRS